MRSRGGQSTFELTLTVVVVIAAVVAMSVFMKRSVMGKLRETGDQVGGQFTPLQTKNSFNRTSKGARREELSFAGRTDTTITEKEVHNRDGTEEVVQGLEDETLFP